MTLKFGDFVKISSVCKLWNFSEGCMTMKHAIDENKSQTNHTRIIKRNYCEHPIALSKPLVLPEYYDPITFASTLQFFK